MSKKTVLIVRFWDGATEEKAIHVFDGTSDIGQLTQWSINKCFRETEYFMEWVERYKEDYPDDNWEDRININVNEDDEYLVTVYVFNFVPDITIERREFMSL